MKYKIVIALFLLMIVNQKVAGQDNDSLNIIDCFRLARNNSPQVEMFDINQSISNLNIENYSTLNYPEINAFGKAWYQSDAVAVPAQVPGAEGFALDKFQYNFGVEVQQKLFDGGISNKKILLEERSLNAQNAETETSIYQIYQQVNQLYFSILFSKENENLLQSKKETLEERIKIMESGVRNGVILKSELDKLIAEKMKLEQQILESQYSVLSLTKNLSVLLGMGQIDQVKLSADPDISLLSTSKRPEYNSLLKREEQLSVLQELKSINLIPKFYAYGQMGYSYPGLNFFENQSDPYYIVGVKLGWQIFDWNETRKEKEILEIQKSSLKIHKEELDRNLLIAENTKNDEINKLNELIKKDKEIVYARESISKSSASALENGTITSADYLVDLNAETEARLNLNKNKIKLMQSKAELLIIKGINIE